MSGRPGAGDRITAMWLAHHYPEDYDRCVMIGRTHVCRRCLALYPLAFAVMLISLALGGSSASLDRVALVLLPLPAVVEFVLEQLGVVRYQPVRQVLVTIPLAVGLGRGFAIYVHHPTSPLFWSVVVVYGAVCGLAVLWRVTRPGNSPSSS